MSLLETLTERWAFVPSSQASLPTCPECGADMAQDYVRQPAFQDHWRGVPAWVCESEECDYAEYREG